MILGGDDPQTLIFCQLFFKIGGGGGEKPGLKNVNFFFFFFLKSSLIDIARAYELGNSILRGTRRSILSLRVRKLRALAKFKPDGRTEISIP